MNITLRQLRAFVAVAKAGSFTAAAARLNLTQSALSGLVRELDPVLSRSFQTCRRRGRTLGPAPARFVEFLNEHVNAPPAS